MARVHFWLLLVYLAFAACNDKTRKAPDETRKVPGAGMPSLTREQIVARHRALLSQADGAPHWTRADGARRMLAVLSDGDELSVSDLGPYCTDAARADRAYQDALSAYKRPDEFTIQDLLRRRKQAVGECLSTMKRNRPPWPPLMLLQVQGRADTYDFSNGILPIELAHDTKDGCGYEEAGTILLGCGVGTLEPRVLLSGFGSGVVDSVVGTKARLLLKLPEEQARSVRQRLAKRRARLLVEFAFIPGDFGETQYTTRPLGGTAIDALVYAKKVSAFKFTVVGWRVLVNADAVVPWTAAAPDP